MILQSLDIKNLDLKKHKDYVEVSATKDKIYFTEQVTGFGVKHFLECPRCSSRREIIYLVDYKYLYCRGCIPINIYKGIQNSTKGGETEIHYRMKQIAKEYGINEWEFPFDYMQLLFSRPKYMRVKKWQEGIRKLQALENMRFQNILYKNKYNSKTIGHVFKNRLYTYTLRDMRDLFINWYD